MRRIMIFSGTTEGRQLSDLLAGRGIEHRVSVASEYGSAMMEESPCRHMHVGRLDAKGMEDYLQNSGFIEGDALVDATHPYAEEISRNARAVAEKLGLSYIRVERRTQGAAEAHEYESMEECAKALCGSEGNILLTTGSKDLPVYRSHVPEECLERSYVRVLPSVESLQICEENGIAKQHILAMQGPFSYELNRALLQQYHIRHLVSKESGSAGGFEEKRRAAQALGVELHLIRRPGETEGVDVAEAYRLLCGEEAPRESMHILLAGYGPGGQGMLSLALKDALEKADIVFGAKRLLEGVSCRKKYPFYKGEDIVRQLKAEEGIKEAVLLYSGDCSFCSGAGKALQQLRMAFPDAVIDMLPGISSLSALAAAAGESLEDAAICSLHGHNGKRDLHCLLAELSCHRKTFTLLSGAEDVRAIAKEMQERGMEAELILGCDLSCPGEQILRMNTEQAAEFEYEGSICALLLNENAQRRRLYPILRDEAFRRAKVPMSKDCVRHESILRLGLREGDTLLDVGGGSGSIAIEAAGLHPSVNVITIEKDASAAALIRENIALHHAENVTLLEGEATEVIAELPKPDAVFIGGSGGKLKEIVRILCQKGEGIRFVVNALTLETQAELMALAEEEGLIAEEILQLSFSSFCKVGRYHLPKAENPVMIFCFRNGGKG